jgi:hypothetical protein
MAIRRRVTNDPRVGQRKRHHLVARFLLKRFAARQDGDKSFIWRVTKDSPPKLLSTKDVAVQSNFYGAEDEGLEAALSDVEGRWATLLRRVDAGEPLEPLADELWHMVYLMAYRASPIRSAFQTMGERFLDHMQENADSPHLKDRLRTYLDEHFDEELAKMLDRFPPQVRGLLWENHGFLKDYAARDLEGMNIGAFMRGLMGEVKKQGAFQSAAKRGHNKGVSKLVAQGSGPAAVRPTEWRLIRDPTGSVILGDCPVVAVGGPSLATGAPWKFGKECRAYYMPISPHQVLVGLRHPGDPLLTADEINLASAALSEASVFASKDTEATRRWSALVATRWMPLEDAEIDALVNEVVREFGRGSHA